MERDQVAAKIFDEISAISKSEFSDASHNLFDEGLLDSLNIVNLIVFIEKTFAIKIDTFDVNPETFATVKLITDYVLNKLGDSSA